MSLTASPRQASKRAKRDDGAAIPTSYDLVLEHGVGEVRFESPQAAKLAMKTMHGRPLNGSPLVLAWDPNSKDGTKINVTNLPAGIEWQELKDHFAPIGGIAFVNIKGGVRRGPKVSGEVRYETADAAAQAMQMLQGTVMEGSNDPISIQPDPNSKDGTKLLISGMPPGTDWKELKDHFRQVGQPIAFVGVGPGCSFRGSGFAEVRYDSPEHAKQALAMLDRTTLQGHQISILPDGLSKDGTKLLVTGLAPSTQWQEVKDHFGKIGPVAFCDVKAAVKGGCGGCKGTFKGRSMDMHMMFAMMRQMMPQMMMHHMMQQMMGAKGSGFDTSMQGMMTQQMMQQMMGGKGGVFDAQMPAMMTQRMMSGKGGGFNKHRGK